MKQIYYFEMTDTFGGENNYSWLHRFIVYAKSPLGAIRQIGKETGYNFKTQGDEIWKVKNACIAAYTVFQYEEPDANWISKATKLGE